MTLHTKFEENWAQQFTRYLFLKFALFSSHFSSHHFKINFELTENNLQFLQIWYINKADCGLSKLTVTSGDFKLVMNDDIAKNLQNVQSHLCTVYCKRGKNCWTKHLHSQLREIVLWEYVCGSLPSSAII